MVPSNLVPKVHVPVVTATVAELTSSSPISTPSAFSFASQSLSQVIEASMATEGVDPDEINQVNSRVYKIPYEIGYNPLQTTCRDRVLRTVSVIIPALPRIVAAFTGFRVSTIHRTKFRQFSKAIRNSVDCELFMSVKSDNESRFHFCWRTNRKTLEVRRTDLTGHFTPLRLEKYDLLDFIPPDQLNSHLQRAVIVYDFSRRFEEGQILHN